MWARTAELMIGFWLVLSPLIFRGTPDAGSFVVRDVAAGSLVVLFSLLSFWRRTEWAHLVTMALALLLGLAAYFGWSRPGPPAAQNEIMVAWMLLLLAIVPNEATRPPRPWRSRQPSAH
jgi:hypothetical protein